MSNVYLSADKYIEYTCERADELMHMIYGDKYLQNDSEGNISYTEKGQEIFNDLLACVEELLSDVGIFHEDEQDRLNAIPRW